MVKVSKLYQRLLESPSSAVTFREFERCLGGFGFVHLRSRGSHRSYRHPEVQEVLTVQPRGKDAQPYQVRRFLAMVRQYDLRPDE